VTVALLAAALGSVGAVQHVVLRGYLLERTYQTVEEEATVAGKLSSNGVSAPRIPGSTTEVLDASGTPVVTPDAADVPLKPGAGRAPWVDPPRSDVATLIGLWQRGSRKAPAPAGGRFLAALTGWLSLGPWTTLPAPGGDVMLTVFPLPVDQVLVAETPLEDVDVLLKADLVIFAATAAAALTAAGTLAVWLTGRALSPLERVAAVAREVSRGDYDRRTGLRGAGEVASLSVAFDEMVDRLEEQIRLERKSEARMRRFLADASHELRTPVTGILGHLEVLRRGALDSRADLEESLAAMHLASERMARLVADLLTLARFEQTEARLRAEPVDAGELVRDAARAARPNTRDHLVTFDPAAGRVAVLGDRDAAERILINLLDNAAKYSPAGSLIALTVRPSAGGRVEVAVADRGPGIPEDERERIFERLYRGDRSRANGADHGAGLGLAICRALARGQGGDVTVRDTPGGGATFVVTLPQAP
jgi:signal transduction histidine kinase